MARQAKVDDVAPDMTSAEELAARLYAPALGAVRAGDSPAWSPAALDWTAA